MQKSKANKIIDKKSENIFKYILITLVAVLIFYPPFLRGLYFEREQLPTEIYTFLIFGIYSLYNILKKEKEFLKSPLDIISFGFVIVYLISIMVSVNTRLAISEWLKYCMYFAIFIMVSDLIRTYKERKIIIWVLIASATGVSILGIDGMAGSHIAGWFNQFCDEGTPLFFSLFVDKRIYSTIQYPNALASMLLAVFFITLPLISQSTKLWQKITAGVCSYVVLITFIFTQSRGAYLLLPIVAILYVIIIPKGHKISNIAIALVPTVNTLIISVVMSKFLVNTTAYESKIWVTFLLGAAITAVTVFITNFFKLKGISFVYIYEITFLVFGFGFLSIIKNPIDTGFTKWVAILKGTLICVILLSCAITYLCIFISKHFEKFKLKYLIIPAITVGVLLLLGAVMAINTQVPLTLVNTNQTAIGINTAKKSVVLEQEKKYKLVFDAESIGNTKNNENYKVDIYNKSKEDILFARQTLLASYTGKLEGVKQNNQINFSVPKSSKIVEINFKNISGDISLKVNNVKIIEESSNARVTNLKLNYKFIPYFISSRFDDIKGTKSVIERGIFYKDGLKLYKQHWLLGAGGGAWSQLYFQHQSYNYSSTQPHNYILQIMIECGVLGLIVYLAFILFILITFIFEYKNLKGKNDNELILLTSVLVGVIAMLIHSFIDFDFSLSGVFIVFWVLVAIINSVYRNMDLNEIKNQNRMSFEFNILKRVKGIKVSPIITLIVAIGILIVPFMFLMATQYEDDASNAYSNKDLNKAIKNMRNAASVDTTNSKYKYLSAYLILQNKSIDKKNYDVAMEYLDSAQKLGNTDYYLMSTISQIYFKTNHIEKAINLSEHVCKLRPVNPKSWDQLISGYTKALFYYKNNKDDKNIEKYFVKLNSVVDKAREANKKNMNPFVLSPESIKIVEVMKYLGDNKNGIDIKDINQLVFYNAPNVDVNLDNIPDQWEVANSTELDIKNNNGIMVVENKSQDKVNYIKSRPIDFKAGKKYSIEVTLKDSEKISEIPFKIVGLNENGVLKQVGSAYKTELVVPADFKANNNALELGIKGKYEIQGARIIEGL